MNTKRGKTMKLLVIDGNSIANRAFYGIKMLTTKDGQFTNAIYGFLNILIKLMTVVALVFAPLFMAINGGAGIFM